VQFDNRDVGLSSYVDWASVPYGIQDMAGDAMGLLDGVGVDAAHLVGVSVGGMVAQAAALQDPDRLRSLTPTGHIQAACRSSASHHIWGLRALKGILVGRAIRTWGMTQVGGLLSHLRGP
jgi:pimeloyl-ACP methyl ester carboxylesterase